VQVSEEREIKLLSLEEVTAIYRAVLLGSGNVPVERAIAAVRWAEETRSRALLLTGVIRGTLAIGIQEDGELLFQSRSHGKEAEQED